MVDAPPIAALPPVELVGKIEAPASARPLRRRLVPPVAVAALVQVVVAAGDRLPAVDGLAYFQAGRNLLGGDGYTRFGQPELHFPPLVPVALGLLERATGSEMAALGTWNVLSGLAVVAALAGLAHTLWHDDAVTIATTWLGGTMTGLGPLFFRHGSGSEAISLALLLGAMILVLAAPADRQRRLVACLLGAGALVGLAYLARPELLMPGLLVGLAAGARAARSRARSLAAVALFVVGLTVFVGPYVAYLHRHTGSWSLTAKSQDVSIDAWRAVAEGDRRERDTYVYALSADGTRLGVEAQPLTQLAAEHPRAWLGIAWTNAGQVAQAYLAPERGGGALVWQLMPAPLVGVALVELWRIRRLRTTWLLAGVGLVPIATCVAFFTLPRYLPVPTAILTLAAARGLVGWSRRLPRPSAAAVVVVCGLLVARSSLAEARPFLPGQGTADPVSHHDAGIWLADHSPADARVMTRSFHVQAYANRPIVAMPVADYDATLAFARLMGVSYLVADPRSPLYVTLAQSDRPEGLQLVAAFGRPSQPMRVYRLDPEPPASDRNPLPLGYVGD